MTMIAAGSALLAGLLAMPSVPAANAAASHYPQTAKLAAQPTAREALVVRTVLAKSFGREWPDFEKSAGRSITFQVGHADLDGDGRPDLLVTLNDYKFGYCGSHGCAGYAILATPGGYAQKPIDLAIFHETVTVLAASHHGMHDLRYDDAHYVFRWDGTQYR